MPRGTVAPASAPRSSQASGVTRHSPQRRRRVLATMQACGPRFPLARATTGENVLDRRRSAFVYCNSHTQARGPIVMSYMIGLIAIPADRERTGAPSGRPDLGGRGLTTRSRSRDGGSQHGTSHVTTIASTRRARARSSSQLIRNLLGRKKGETACWRPASCLPGSNEQRGREPRDPRVHVCTTPRGVGGGCGGGGAREAPLSPAGAR